METAESKKFHHEGHEEREGFEKIAKTLLFTMKNMKGLKGSKENIQMNTKKSVPTKGWK
jgi:hypothetical protein